MKLKDKTAIVTGAARGIGRAIAVALSREGARVALVDVKPCLDSVKLLQKEGFPCLDIPADVSSLKDVKAMVKRARERLGRIDILVNNAGIIQRGDFLDLLPADWQRVIDVNLGSVYHCCSAVVPIMIGQGGGKIINITSVAGLIGDITASPAYGASKGGANALTKSLARQLAPHHILVNAVAPHAIETDMSQEWPAEKKEAVVSAIPLGRMGKPEEVAAAVVFLSSSDADYITGEVLNINGGFLMH